MIIGIDLGTTNSLVAYFTEEGPKIIPNRLGKRLTPSVVSIDEEEQVYVGDLAVERGLLCPGSAASVFKRDMGSDKKFQLLQKSFRAEELSSLLLRALKEDAEHYLGEEVTEAVHRNTGAPKEHIHIIINEMKKGNYAVDGKWK